MKERIKQVMDSENLTPAQFADKLQINRAVISHILNGRNNPSLDVVTKILGEMDYISSDWLLSGKGEMYKEDANIRRHSVSQQKVDLFTQSVINEAPTIGKPVETTETAVKHAPFTYNAVENKPIEIVKVAERKVSQIIIYYSDNTFEVFKA